MLILFFINGLFATAFSPVSASDLASTSDLSDESWSTKMPMNQARAGLGVVVDDGKIYAIGGQTDDGFVGTNERYDPKTGKWVNLKPMPTQRVNFAIAAYQGKIYCIGGESREGVYSGVEVYDVATDSWSAKKDISFDGHSIQAHVVYGKNFVVKKHDFSWETPYTFTLDVYRYNISTDEWAQEDIPYTNLVATGSAMFNFVSVAMDDKIMIYFKYIEPGNLWYDVFDKAMIYDPKTDAWIEVITPPNYLGYPARTLDRAFGGCMTSDIYAPKKIYFFQEKRTTVYDPVKTTWQDVASIPESRIDFGVAIVNDIMYVIGGKNTGDYNDFLSINEQYIPKGYTGTIPPDTTPTTTSTPNSNRLIIGIAIITMITVVTTGILITKKKQK
jgi:N-acetylneuraminic acid mutarotase